MSQSSLFPEIDTDVAPETAPPSGRFAEVVFDRPLDHAYTYAIPEGLSVDPGQRVLVPFGQGNRPTVGFCVGTTEEAPSRAVKSLLQVLDPEPIVTPNLMKLTRWMADYYVAGWGQVLNGVVPAGAKAAAGTRTVALIEPMPIDLRRDPAPTLSPKQQAALAILDKVGHALEIRELARQVGCGPGPIRGLIDKGLGLRKVGRVETPATFDESTTAPATIEPAVAPALTPDQQAVWDDLAPSLRKGGFHAHLLYGVTGSGKTELYLRAIEEVVRQGKEALVLVPEISLTPQTIRAFRGRCGEVAVLHSHLQEAQRGGHWRRIASGQVQVVVGARSAIFAPTRNLGLIVIDEEHEPSFKQETTPRYHGRDVAVMRARIENIPILLGSATPSLESWHNAQRGQYRLHELPKRVHDRPMPRVHLIDLRHDKHPDKLLHGLSPTLEREMRRALDAGGQVILFLNRRGFSTNLLCPSCGHVEMCKFCDLALTFHKERNLTLCHYCGYEKLPVHQCPECSAPQIRYHGMGTEKLEAEILTKFPRKTVRRMDSDSMKKPGSHAKTLDAFGRGEIDILVGTQMIAKGLDFPNVTLVGVINADVGLHHADFRAPERTFQLLAQVAGRTGRGPRGGIVMVQSFTPEHPSITLAAKHDYRTFAVGEPAVRHKHGYPPYQRMARLVMRGKDEAATQAFADRLAAAFGPALGTIPDSPAAGIRVIGPAEAPIFRLKNLYRFHFQLQSPSSATLHQVLRQVLGSVRVPSGIELAIDIDPQDML
jgi:primosomal protein N' (replication factor Y) (superfamily II helicase)